MASAVFADRVDAGRRLGAELASRAAALGLDDARRAGRAVVLGIPRGGVLVAAQVATALDLPLGVAVARKVGAPGQPELALGAVGPDGAAVLDPRLAARVGATAEWLDTAVEEQRAAVAARLAGLPERYRRPDVAGRTVIVVDDGVATGATAAAVGRWLAQAGATRRILALPVAPPATEARLRGEYDDVIALDTPAEFFAVGQAYKEFGQTTDEEVARLLGEPDVTA